LSGIGALDITHLRSWIGRTETETDIVTPGLVRKFAATFNLDAASSEPSKAAPLGIHLCLAPKVAPTGAIGPDGHPATGDFLPPVPLPRRMWAGGEQWLEHPLRVGDEVRRTSSIIDVQSKTGRAGLLCFVTVEHRFEVDQVLALKERHDIVYREAAAPTVAGRPPAEIELGRWQKRFEMTPTLLFRYSAITFNSHRIHYDNPYSVQVEHYPGLVVHGPLQMTLLHNMAAEIRGGQPPKRFSFRATAPAFAGGALTLHAREAGTILNLWTSTNGAKAMEAEAEW
jgi:3-methylfumaryl-CoA hydratase